MPESNTQTNKLPESAPSPNNNRLSVEIAIHYDDADLSTSKIQDIVLTILHDFDWKWGEVSIAIVDDPTIHDLNRRYLNHDYETDVLSFVLESDEQQRRLEGEIVVSGDTAKTMAAENGVAWTDELLVYIIHGALHLAGLDDKRPDSRVEMRNAEQCYTDKFDVDYVAPAEPNSDGVAD